jgi:hypothetical protein
MASEVLALSSDLTYLHRAWMGMCDFYGLFPCARVHARTYINLLSSVFRLRRVYSSSWYTLKWSTGNTTVSNLSVHTVAYQEKWAIEVLK